MSSYSAFSIFNKTIKDKKCDISLNLYTKKIAPKLIKLLYKEIIEKYPRIYHNISTSMQNHSKGLMVSLSLQAPEMLSDNYKRLYLKEKISSIIDKEKLLKNFEKINVTFDNV